MFLNFFLAFLTSGSRQVVRKNIFSIFVSAEIFWDITILEFLRLNVHTLYPVYV